MRIDNSIDLSNKSKSTHPPQVKKLANLEQRLARWEAQKKENRKYMITFALITLPVVMLCMFGAGHLMGEVLDLNLFAKGVLISVMLMIPPVVLQRSKPFNRKPTQADVDADIKLRKAFKMDSSVND